MAGMIQEQREPVFQKIVDGIEKKIPKEMKRDYTAIVTAGMKVLFGDDTHKLMLQKLDEGRKAGDIPGAITKGTVMLIGLIAQQAGEGAMSPGAAFPAAATLMCYIFEFAEAQEPGRQYSNDVVAESTRTLMRDLALAMGIGPEQMAQGIDQLRSANSGEEADTEDMPPEDTLPAEAPGALAPGAPPQAMGV